MIKVLLWFDGLMNLLIIRPSGLADTTAFVFLRMRLDLKIKKGTACVSLTITSKKFAVRGTKCYQLVYIVTRLRQ